MSAGEGELYRLLDEAELRVCELEEASTAVFVAIYKAIQAGYIPERGPIADSSLILRDALNPNWPNDSNWLPDGL